MSETTSLFDRIGGEAAVESLVIAFYVRVMADPELAPFFRGTSIAKMHTMQREFFSMALGGPVSYTGRPLGHVHQGRGITPKAFARFVGHLLDTLEEQGITQAEAIGVIDRINSYANEVMGTSY